MEDNYIERLIEKVNKLEDEELKMLIKRLIDEKIKLDDISKIDQLTGLYNRRILENIVDYGIVVMCDVDNFKYINDTYGHDIGDDVIKIVSKKIKSNTRHEDIVCRYGGDEFLIIFYHCSLDVVVNRMQKIQKEIEDILSSLSKDVSISIGISDYKNDISFGDRITEADKALYISKNEGKKKLTIYDNVKDKLKIK